MQQEGLMVTNLQMQEGMGPRTVQPLHCCTLWEVRGEESMESALLLSLTII